MRAKAAAPLGKLQQIDLRQESLFANLFLLSGASSSSGEAPAWTTPPLPHPGTSDSSIAASSFLLRIDGRDLAFPGKHLEGHLSCRHFDNSQENAAVDHHTLPATSPDVVRNQFRRLRTQRPKLRRLQTAPWSTLGSPSSFVRALADHHARRQDLQQGPALLARSNHHSHAVVERKALAHWTGNQCPVPRRATPKPFKQHQPLHEPRQEKQHGTTPHKKDPAQAYLDHQDACAETNLPNFLTSCCNNLP